MNLTRKNYYSQKANNEYMSVSQYKTFRECPARAIAEINGEWKREETTALLQGQFLDALLDKKADEFCKAHPDMLTQKGSLRADFEKVEQVFEVIKSDKTMYKLLTGKRQKIMTGVIGGVQFKIMIDSLHPDKIVDGKLMKDFDGGWANGEKLNWWKQWGYDVQGAVYQEIVVQNTGRLLPFDLVAATKEKVPDKAWVRFSDITLALVLEEVEHYAPQYQAMKEGIMEAPSCGVCDYCKAKKMLESPEII